MVTYVYLVSSGSLKREKKNLEFDETSVVRASLGYSCQIMIIEKQYEEPAKGGSLALAYVEEVKSGRGSAMALK